MSNNGQQDTATPTEAQQEKYVEPTPAPWFRGGIDGDIMSLIGVEEHFVLTVDSDAARQYDKKEYEANMRLICMAPKLLAACRESYALLDRALKEEHQDEAYTLTDKACDIIERVVLEAVPGSPKPTL